MTKNHKLGVTIILTSYPRMCQAKSSRCQACQAFRLNVSLEAPSSSAFDAKRCIWTLGQCNNRIVRPLLMSIETRETQHDHVDL